MAQQNKQARQTFHCVVLNSHFIQPFECECRYVLVLFVCLSVRLQASVIPLRFRYFGRNFFPHSRSIEGKSICATHSTIFAKPKLFFADVADREKLKSAKNNWDKTTKIWQCENIPLYGLFFFSATGFIYWNFQADANKCKTHWNINMYSVLLSNRFHPLEFSSCKMPGENSNGWNRLLRRNEYTNINIYILGVFTEKPYSKPLECNVVYIPIIILSHATSHDFKWCQNKPWLSTIWLECQQRHDVIDAVPLLAEKLLVNVFLLQF